jgi:Rhs element Vgr protein
MADSPLDNASDVIKLSLKVEGEDVTTSVKIFSVHVRKSVNRISSATIRLIDGDMAEQSFPQSDETTFAPGAEVEVLAGYGAEEKTVFKGIILKHGLKIDGNNSCFLELECKDAAVKMTVSRNSENFNKLAEGDLVKDSVVMTDILGNYPELTASVESTEIELDSLVQYQATDWDFLLTRAEANAMLTFNSDGEVAVKKPDLSADPVLTLTYGKDIYSFNADVDPSFQFKQVTGVSWDPTTQKAVEESVAAEADSSTQSETNVNLDEVIGLKDLKLQSQTAQQQSGLKEWANAQLMKSQLSVLRGNVTFAGSSLLYLGAMIELKNVGKRFTGNVFVSEFEHTIADGTWTTDVMFGSSAHWFHSEKDISSPLASGLVPPANGLQIAVVRKIHEDPAKLYRIQVELPVLGAKKAGIWARMLHNYASNTCGSFFLPEIDDEVILGYLNDDPAYPVILGSVYSSKNVPPAEPAEENYIKMLMTKSELKIQFDDEKKIITIETPGGHSFVMDDDAKKISLTDLNGNVIETSESGLSISSPKDITLKADGSISFKAGKDIKGSATGDFSAEGMNVDLSAKTAFTAKGNATAEVSASGNTTVKGAMVMIN